MEYPPPPCLKTQEQKLGIPHSLSQLAGIDRLLHRRGVSLLAEKVKLGIGADLD